MTTQDKEAVEAAEKHASNIVGHIETRWAKEDFLAGVEFQKQREKPVIGETHGDD